MGIYRNIFSYSSSVIGKRPLVATFLMVCLCTYANAQYSELWVYGFIGGLHNWGFIYKTNNHGGQLRIVHHFPGAEGGQYPNGDLFLGPDGLIYGTASGGLHGLGMIFKVDPINSELKIVCNFETELPSGSMTLASDGKLYGYTSRMGEIYTYDPALGTYEVLHAFNITDGKLGVTATKMIEIEPNVLYGVTVLGEVKNGGLIFRYDANESRHEIVYEFDGQNGFKPGNIELFSDGKLYGIADGGEEFDKGVIFRFDPETGEVSTVHEFGATYHWVLNALLEASNGKFYGIATIGGFDGHGAVWEYDPVSDEAVFIQKFAFSSGTHIPDAPLMEAFDQNIYGTTRYGGSGAGLGTIFQCNPVEESFNYASSLNDGFPIGNTILEFGERTVDEISLSSERRYMEIGEQMQLTATLLPEETQGQSVIWAVDDPEIATITEEGMLTAVGKGSVKVIGTANQGLGVSDSIRVSVFNPGMVISLPENPEITIFPNPVIDGKIGFDGLTLPAQYKVTDLSGKAIFQGDVHANEIMVSLNAGVYVLQLISAD